MLLLASASPRRRRLLELLGVPAEVCSTEVDESPLRGERPDELALRLARAKAEAALVSARAQTVLAADSVVAIDGEAVGKPASAEQAQLLLRRLRGRVHEVLTGLAVLGQDEAPLTTSLTCTRVFMRDYSDGEIDAYVASGQPMDKAGAYGIQDTPFRPVARLEGCYPNVIGLPLCQTQRFVLGDGKPAATHERLTPPCHLCWRAADAFGERSLNALYKHR